MIHSLNCTRLQRRKSLIAAWILFGMKSWVSLWQNPWEFSIWWVSSHLQCLVYCLLVFNAC